MLRGKNLGKLLWNIIVRKLDYKNYIFISNKGKGVFKVDFLSYFDFD